MTRLELNEHPARGFDGAFHSLTTLFGCTMENSRGSSRTTTPISSS